MEFQKVIEYYKAATEILRNVESPIKMVVLAAILLVIFLWGVVSTTSEVLKAFREKREGLMNLEQKFPRIFSFLYSGKVRFVLLLIVMVLLAIDWHDATTISPPIAQIKMLPPPNVVFSNTPVKCAAGPSQKEIEEQAAEMNSLFAEFEREHSNPTPQGVVDWVNEQLREKRRNYRVAPVVLMQKNHPPAVAFRNTFGSVINGGDLHIPCTVPGISVQGTENLVNGSNVFQGNSGSINVNQGSQSGPKTKPDTQPKPQ